MANANEGGGRGAGGAGKPRRQLKVDRVVETVAPDPNQHQPSVLVTGYLGKSAQEGTWRLYLSPDLSEYVEFAESDVVHHVSHPEEQSPLGGTTVWLKAGTSLHHVQVVAQQIQADFLGGGLASTLLTNAGFSTLRRRNAETGVACTRNYVCSTNPHIPACQVRTEVCGSAFCDPTGALCPTGAFIKGC